MMREYVRFLVLLLVFSVIFASILYFFIPSLPPKFRYDDWWKIMAFFTLTTAAFHLGLLKSVQKRPAAVTIYYMAVTTIKLLLYAGIMIAYSMLNKAQAPAFIVSFFLMYFVFTVFEVGVLYKKFSTPVDKSTSGPA